MTRPGTFGRAARGDREAQAEIADFWLEVEGINEADRLAQARVFAELAAAHGGRKDRQRLAAVIVRQAFDDLKRQKVGAAIIGAAHAVPMLFDLIDEGDPEAVEAMDLVSGWIASWGISDHVNAQMQLDACGGRLDG